METKRGVLVFRSTLNTATRKLKTLCSLPLPFETIQLADPTRGRGGRVISTNYEAYHHHRHHCRPSCYRSFPPPLSHIDTPPRMLNALKYYLLCKFVCSNKNVLVLAAYGTFLCCCRFSCPALSCFLPLARSAGLELYYQVECNDGRAKSARGFPPAFLPFTTTAAAATTTH